MTLSEEAFYRKHFSSVRTIAPEENCPQLGLGFGLVLGLDLRLGAVFLWGNCPITIFSNQF